MTKKANFETMKPTLRNLGFFETKTSLHQKISKYAFSFFFNLVIFILNHIKIYLNQLIFSHIYLFEIY